MFDLSAIDANFPIQINGQPSYRDGQKNAIEFALNAFNNGKRVVIIEAPTGSGKSVIAMTLCNMMDRSYYLTSTKILQDQLTNEFEDVVDLKGRNAYPCTFYPRFGPEMVKRGIWNQQQLDTYLAKAPDCNSGFCKSKTNKQANAVNGNGRYKCLKCYTEKGPNGNGRPGGDLKVLPLGMTYSACPYHEQVFKAINSRKVTMNFSSFLFQTQMTKRFDIPRDLLVLDESHNTEGLLLDFVNLTISDADLLKYGILIPPFDTALEYASFFADVDMGRQLDQAIEEAGDNDKTWLEDELIRTRRKYDTFMKHVQESEWVADYEEVKSTGSHKVTLRPVFVNGMAHNLLFKYAHHIVLMSATILDVDVVCNALGINRSHVAAIRLKNRFPVENRPIYLDTVAKMTGGPSQMGVWGPALVKGINKHVENYKGKRGIIHTHNFAIQELLKTKCARHVKERFIFQQDFNNDKKLMLEAHAKRPDSVIVAPAMHEGIDLRDDLSRFQLICKVPYANCFDNKQLARRVDLDRRFYDWLTAVKLVQSYGRSIRSDTDYADTYILDESIHRFISVAKKMLPDWFLEAIKT